MDSHCCKFCCFDSDYLTTFWNLDTRRLSFFFFFSEVIVFVGKHTLRNASLIPAGTVVCSLLFFSWPNKDLSCFFDLWYGRIILTAVSVTNHAVCVSRENNCCCWCRSEQVSWTRYGLWKVDGCARVAPVPRQSSELPFMTARRQYQQMQQSRQMDQAALGLSALHGSR